MKLFLAKNTVSIAVAIALEEAGLAYTPEVLDFGAGAQTKPEYLAIKFRKILRARQHCQSTILNMLL